MYTRNWYVSRESNLLSQGCASKVMVEEWSEVAKMWFANNCHFCWYEIRNEYRVGAVCSVWSDGGVWVHICVLLLFYALISRFTIYLYLCCAYTAAFFISFEPPTLGCMQIFFVIAHMQDCYVNGRMSGIVIFSVLTINRVQVKCQSLSFSFMLRGHHGRVHRPFLIAQ